jgi:hypothetical protein
VCRGYEESIAATKGGGDIPLTFPYSACSCASLRAGGCHHSWEQAPFWYSVRGESERVCRVESSTDSPLTSTIFVCVRVPGVLQALIPLPGGCCSGTCPVHPWMPTPGP